MGTEKDYKRRDAMPGMIVNALEALKPYGKPEFDKDGRQKRIEITCKGEGWELPVMGYIDFHYPEHGLVIDLKTTMKMPSTMSVAHKRQAAIYSGAMGNQTVKFLYVTNKKSGILENEDIPGTLREIKSLLSRQERFLSLGDKETLRKLVSVNYNTFYWNGMEHIRKELFED